MIAFGLIVWMCTFLLCAALGHLTHAVASARSMHVFAERVADDHQAVADNDRLVELVTCSGDVGRGA